MRVMLWDAVATEAPQHPRAAGEAPRKELAALSVHLRVPAAGQAASGPAASSPRNRLVERVPAPVMPGPAAPAFVPSEGMPTFAPPPAPTPAAPLAPVASRAASPVAMAAGHQLLWMAAVSQMPLPADLLSGQASSAPGSRGRQPRANPRRWSADGWLLLRRGSTPGLAAGSALRAMAPARRAWSCATGWRRHRRIVRRSICGRRRRSMARPRKWRPWACRPGPCRACRSSRRSNCAWRASRRRAPAPGRPGLQRIPRGRTAAGAARRSLCPGRYAGGRDATAFADGQLRFDRRIARTGSFELRAGGGVWGGAQKGAARIDAGPTASLGASVPGGGALRLGVDWRFRLAGNAAPVSGPALTLSAGF